MDAQIETPRGSPRVYSWRDMPARRRDPRETLRALGAIGNGTAGAVAASKGAGGSVINFTSFFTGANILQAVQSDIGVTLVSGGVSVWADQASSPHNFTQGTAGARPTMTTGLNGFPGVLFDGVDDFVDSTLNIPAPGTTPCFVWGVYRIISAPAGSSTIFGSTAFVEAVISQVSRNSAGFNGTIANSNSGSAAGAWGRVECLFTNSTSDYCKFGATVVSGANAGNSTQNGRAIGGNSGGGSCTNVEVLAYVLLNALPSGGQLAAASAAVTSKYGVSVAV